MSPRRRAPRRLDEALDRVLGRVAPQTPLGTLASVWEAAVGPELARRSEPVSERDGVVTVGCESSVWASEMALMHDDLLASVRREAPGVEVSELRFGVSN